VGSSPIFLASTICMCVEKHSWRPDKAVLPPSFRRFNGPCGTAGRERSRVWEWPVRTLCKRKPRKARTPMPHESGRLPPTRIFSRCGKMPRPRHSHPEGSQSGVCEAAVAEWLSPANDLAGLLNRQGTKLLMDFERCQHQNYYEFTTVVRFEAFRPNDEVVGTS